MSTEPDYEDLPPLEDLAGFAESAVDGLPVPPHSIQAEQAVLGGLMLNNEAWDQIADMISVEDFYRREHKSIFEGIHALADQNRPCDLVTLAEELEQRGQLADIGGIAYLGALVDDTPVASNVPAYVTIVRERSVIRQLIQIGNRIAESGYRPAGRKVHELLDEAEVQVFRIAEQLTKGRAEFHPVTKLLTKAVDRIEELFSSDKDLTGVATGFHDFDQKTSGLQNADLIIVAGRPSMGKCIMAGSRVLDPATGRLEIIDDLVVRRHGNIATLTTDYRFQSAHPTQFVDDGVKPVFRVRTTSGREINATLTHPFLTIHGWKPLAELQVGDRIGAPRKLPFFGTGDLSEQKTKLAAYFLTDGCLTRACPQFTNINPHIRQDFIAALDDFPGVQACLQNSRGTRTPSLHVAMNRSFLRQARQTFSNRLRQRLNELSLSLTTLAAHLGVAVATVHYWTIGKAAPAGNTLGLLCRELHMEPTALMPYGVTATQRSTPNPVTEWLNEIGLMGKTAHEKRVPACIFELPAERMAIFINRAFACDGSVYVQNGDQVGISYSTVNYGLAKDMRHLLLRFGILAKLRHRRIKYQNAYRPAYELRITHQQHVRDFLQRIGVYGKEEAVMEALSVSRTKTAKIILDTLPKETWALIAERKRDLTWAELARRMGRKPGHNFHVGKRGVGRALLTEIARALGDAELANLATSDLYWDPIESIHYLGEKQVYDLSVPDTHNFVAEDVLVHNTSFAMNIAENVAIGEKLPVAIFSMEMPGEQLTLRMISSLGRINQQAVRSGKLQDDDWPRITSAVNLLSQTKIFIDDTPALNPTELRARCRRLMREQGQLGLVVIDYLQLMQMQDSNENRATEISAISRSLKALAKELNVPVIALSQLNRSLEQRPNKRPVMSDLRESGAIEQDADLIVFIYRDEVYHEDTIDKGKAEIVIGKQRNGPIGTVHLSFQGQYVRFDNLAQEAYEAYIT